MILSAQSIRSLCVPSALFVPGAPLIHPFCARTVVRGKSYGLSAASYDVRISRQYRIRPGEFILASTIERVSFPHDVVAFVKDKSSWARQGLAVQNTLIDPGFRGHVTLELSHHGDEGWLDIEAGDPIAQLVFCRLDQPTDIPYSGKYQDQGPDPQPVIFETSPGIGLGD